MREKERMRENGHVYFFIKTGRAGRSTDINWNCLRHFVCCRFWLRATSTIETRRVSETKGKERFSLSIIIDPFFCHQSINWSISTQLIFKYIICPKTFIFPHRINWINNGEPLTIHPTTSSDHLVNFFPKLWFIAKQLHTKLHSHQSGENGQASVS